MIRIVMGLAVAGLVSAQTVYAAVQNTQNLTPEEKKALFMRRTGGFIEQPGSMKGCFAILNTQTEIPAAEFETVAAYLKEELKFDVKVSVVKPDAPAKLVAATPNKVGVVVVADDDSPSLLVAPEDGWAVLNVRKLSKGLETDSAKAKFVPARFRKELMKAFSCVAGGTRSSFSGNLMSVKDYAALDLAPEVLPADKVENATEYLKEIGFTPLRRVTYVRACREGWAPAPTNDIQKLAWEKVHELPTKPIVIKPETK